MDDIVRQAMAKWPNVPAVYGWLSLSRRGEWRIKSERISNPIVTEFINRNYTHDEQGHWFFQNGPQRVYALLDYTPLIYRYADNQQIETHTGSQVQHFDNAFIDEAGSLLLNSPLGIGVIDDRDLDKFLSLLVDQNGEALTPAAVEKLSQLVPARWRDLFLKTEKGALLVENILTAEVATRFGFNPNPRQSEGEEECH
ncbi:MAG: DUF2946 family protein [Burkholderiales bacterium]